MTSTLVLLPTLNERENLPRVVPRLSALEEEVDVLVLDDASPDGTGALAEEMRLRYPRLSVLHRLGKEGLGPAYVHGFREALRRGYRRVVTMDADLSHSPEDVPRLLWALEDADVAVGSRHVPGGRVEDWPLPRRLLSRTGSLYARSLLGLPVRDVTSGFRAYRAEALGELALERVRSRGFVFQVEILRRILDLPGARAVEVPIVFRNRALGRSKLSRSIVSEAALEVLALSWRRRQAPRRQYLPLDLPRRHQPTVTVVIPTRPGSSDPHSLQALRALSWPRGKLEVVVAEGTAPARQRNEAVRATRGEFLLFLDDDSVPSPELLERYLEALRRDPTAGAAGGPAEHVAGAGFQGLATLLLSEPWVVGKTASRYRARGSKRFTDERELIGSNLLVRRRAFELVGGFNEALYPNEENELLERMRRAGSRLLYLPEARVTRPQRETLREFLLAVHGYGRGRGAQLRALPSRTSLLRSAWALLAVVGLMAAFAAGAWGAGALAMPLVIYAGYLALLSVRLSARAAIGRGIVGAALGALLHGAYAAGVLRGLLRPRSARGDSEVQIRRREVAEDPEVEKQRVA